MGFGDKLKDLRKQAQEAVSEHSEHLHNALDVAGAAANEKTHGKHTQRIVKFGEKASEKLDKFATGDGSDEAGAAAEAAAPEAGAAEGAVAEAGAAESAAPEGDASVAAAEQPAASAEPETSVPPPAPAPSSPPPAAPAPNPDLAAWAAGDDGAGQ